MAKREWFPKQRDWTQKHRNVIVYVLAVLGMLGAAVGWALLPDTVSVNPESANTVARPREMMVGLHAGIIALFTALFWKRPRELVYLCAALFGVVMLYLMLYSNLGVPGWT